MRNWQRFFQPPFWGRWEKSISVSNYYLKSPQNDFQLSTVKNFYARKILRRNCIMAAWLILTSSDINYSSLPPVHFSQHPTIKSNSQEASKLLPILLLHLSLVRGEICSTFSSLPFRLHKNTQGRRPKSGREKFTLLFEKRESGGGEGGGKEKTLAK